MLAMFLSAVAGADDPGNPAVIATSTPGGAYYSYGSLSWHCRRNIRA
jgi:hypothetical protein